MVSEGSLCGCSVTKSGPTLCNTIDCNTPDLPVPHHLPEFAQIINITAKTPSNISWCFNQLPLIYKNFEDCLLATLFPLYTHSVPCLLCQSSSRQTNHPVVQWTSISTKYLFLFLFFLHRPRILNLWSSKQTSINNRNSFLDFHSLKTAYQSFCSEYDKCYQMYCVSVAKFKEI